MSKDKIYQVIDEEGCRQIWRAFSTLSDAQEELDSKFGGTNLTPTNDLINDAKRRILTVMKKWPEEEMARIMIDDATSLIKD
jgi:hypothetical protein